MRNAPKGGIWDLLVIGGGTAGMVAATTAAQLGASVLLAERDRTGGDCLWTGCVPSKALLRAAHAAAEARNIARLGVRVTDVEVDFGSVLRRVHQVIAAIEPVDSPDALRAAGVTVAQFEGRFTGPDSALVGSSPARFRAAVIATGSAPLIPPIPGLEQAAPLTSDTVWSLPALPRRLLVLGGGSVGCELAQAFARLGSSVTIVEATGSLLATEDPEASALVAAALAEDGVQVRTAATMIRVTEENAARYGHLDDGSVVSFDEILLAVGRRPRSDDLGLELAGVAVDGRGCVQVDPRLRTSNQRVWAAGDVTGLPPFTHVAGVLGSMAASNAILGLRRSVDIGSIPRVTFTRPEVAAVGVGGRQLGRRRGVTARTIPHTEVDRAVTDGVTGGFTRLFLDRSGRVVGGLIVGPRAGESLAEIVLAVRHRLRARDLAAAMHAYPTYSDGIWKAAISQVGGRLRRPVARRAIALGAWLRRRSLR
jgi:pyruvate/2-oxoglutarate dehydrogenase complex dihydrolipoamide dehydrogenase (E3) component